MRLSMLVPLAALAACGGEEQQKAKAPPPPQALQAGQWQMSYEVINFRRADEGRPRLDMPVGTRGSASACIADAETARPPMGLFAGSEFENCAWRENFYMRNGRLVSSGLCRRDGVGQVEVTISADFTGTTFNGTAEMLTRLVSDGDVVLATRIEGRRIGDCSAGAEGGNQANGQ
ncbi:MAG TPA: DUF3617 family protein [Allosphingosinicella sp.]|nr:DUF3617 family protein [Allosphingosinicella sp.]